MEKIVPCCWKTFCKISNKRFFFVWRANECKAYFSGKCWVQQITYDFTEFIYVVLVCISYCILSHFKLMVWQFVSLLDPSNRAWFGKSTSRAGAFFLACRQRMPTEKQSTGCSRHWRRWLPRAWSETCRSACLAFAQACMLGRPPMNWQQHKCQTGSMTVDET